MSKRQYFRKRRFTIWHVYDNFYNHLRQDIGQILIRGVQDRLFQIPKVMSYAIVRVRHWLFAVKKNYVKKRKSGRDKWYSCQLYCLLVGNVVRSVKVKARARLLRFHCSTNAAELSKRIDETDRMLPFNSERKAQIVGPPSQTWRASERNLQVMSEKRRNMFSVA